MISLKKRVLANFLLIAALSPAALFSAQQDWTWRNPQPQGNDISSICFGNGVFVAAAKGGHVLFSADAARWQLLETGITNDLNEVSFLNQRFVVVGSRGAILYSDDGHAWTKRGTFTNDLKSVTYGNGIYVAVGNGGRVLFSSDLDLWSGSSVGANIFLSGVAFGQDRFIALSETGQTYISTDAFSWTPSQDLPGYTTRMVYFKGRFFTCDSEVSSSPDGSGWTSKWLNPGPEFLSICGDKLVGSGYSGAIFTSLDGEDWTTTNPYGSNYDLTGAAYGNGVYAAVGLRGTILTSSDAVTWHEITASIVQRDDLTVAASDGDRVFVGGEFSISPGGQGQSSPVLWSSNGASWQRANFLGSLTLRSFAFGPDRVVLTDGWRALASTNGGADWTASEHNFESRAHNALYARGKFFVTGPSNKYWTSTDGLVWVEQAITVSSISEIGPMLEVDGVLIALATTSGGSSAMLTSTNGLQWTRKALQRMRGFAHGNGVTVAVGDQGRVAYSTNKIDWVQPGAISNNHLNAVAFGSGTFMAVGDRGTVLTSRDGISWTPFESPAGVHLLAITAFKNTFIAVGANASILQYGSVSEHRLRIVNLSTTEARILLEGDEAATFTLQSTPDLNEPWSDLGDFQTSAKTAEFKDHPATPKRFYRAIQRN